MKNILIPCALLFAFLVTTPAQAQRKSKSKSKTESVATTITAASRVQPLFGGLSAAQAEQALGATYLGNIQKSFASRTEASDFFATKGFEYLNEGQIDTATYRLNLAWVLNPKNPLPYRGLGVIASQQPTPDASIDLLNQALALAPNDNQALSDLGSLYLIRYEQTKKKKDLSTSTDFLNKALAADSTNATAWQQLARVYYIQEDYAKAWNAVHQGQKYSVASIDFNFISELIAKQPDPQGTFK
ncbi:tetratricopeptide repeat protein [Hymenobacter sp. NBH84]|uniref:tetratricopeptide repeat protein n=1 Tax=Hymenobacter sp. NBH84 TaxID=2596915 RepID=UPI001629F4E1|nr:tetratricopeptide repeat protein [Hymenobacter sp. NBH84]QNE40908.1 tetratricopeptide repeat protein [Hymenobacter sp. NBH84]